MAKTSSRAKKRVAIALAAALTLTGAGAAFAFWTGAGTGVGTATTGQGEALTITSTAAQGTLAPGNDGQTVAFTVTNNTDSPLYLTTVTVAIATSTGVAWTPPNGCLITDFAATISTAPIAGDLNPGASVSGTATVILDDTSVNQDACKGQNVPLYFVAS